MVNGNKQLLLNQTYLIYPSGVRTWLWRPDNRRCHTTWPCVHHEQGYYFVYRPSSLRPIERAIYRHRIHSMHTLASQCVRLESSIWFRHKKSLIDWFQVQVQVKVQVEIEMHMLICFVVFAQSSSLSLDLAHLPATSQACMQSKHACE